MRSVAIDTVGGDESWNRLQVIEDTENQASWKESFVAFFLKGINLISMKDKLRWELDHTKNINE